MNTDGFRDYIFHADETMKFPYQDEEFIRMWVADMEFATPDVVIDGIKKRLEKRIFGYTRVFEKSYYDAFAAWCKSNYDWTFDRKELVMSNGIIPALFEMVEYICKPDEKVLFLTPSLSLIHIYWGGTGLAQYAGLIPESMERAEQCQKVLDANEEYDFCFFAGNSDEALSTHSGKPGAEDYSLRENMEKAVRILKKRAERCV